MDRDKLPSWIDNQNVLVLGTEKCSHFLLLNSANDDVIQVFPSPAKGEEILDRLSELPEELPTGHQHVKVIAIGDAGSNRGHVGFALQGKNAGAKRASDDWVQHAKALNASINATEQQMATMAARSEAANQRAIAAEERAGNMLASQFDLVQTVQKLLLKEEAAQVSVIEAQGRAAALKAMGEQMAGPLMMAAQAGYEYWSARRDKEKLELEILRNQSANMQPPRTEAACSPQPDAPPPVPEPQPEPESQTPDPDTQPPLVTQTPKRKGRGK